MYYMMDGHYGIGFGWIFQLIIMFMFIGIVIWILNSHNKTDSRSATEILKERLAKGEITLKEYKELKKEIE